MQANAKVTREDWLQAALDTLVADGLGEVKILRLAERLGVSRSSFYWYFHSRRDLLDALIAHWDVTNTGALVRHANAPHPTITAAICYVFRCFLDSDLFSPTLDFAVRDWSRRDPAVRAALDRADSLRIEALRAMFARYGYTDKDAYVRARILYYMQIGYYAVELTEPIDERIKRTPEYVFAYSGQVAQPAEVEDLIAFAKALPVR